MFKVIRAEQITVCFVEYPFGYPVHDHKTIKAAKQRCLCSGDVSISVLAELHVICQIS